MFRMLWMRLVMLRLRPIVWRLRIAVFRRLWQRTGLFERLWRRDGGTGLQPPDAQWAGD